MAPRIPIYTAQTSPRGLGAGPSGALPNVQGPGAEISRLGAALGDISQQLGNAELRKKEEDAAAWSAEQLSKARLDWTQQQIEREQNAPAGASGYAGQLSTDFDTYTESVLQNAPTEAARNYLRNQFTGLKTSLIGRGMEFEARSRLNDRLDKVNTAVDQSRIAVDLDPSQYQVALAENLSTLQALDIPETQKREIAQKATQALSFASVSSRLRNNPGGVLQQLGSQDGGGALDVRALSADNRLRLRNEAEAEMKRREAEAKQAAAISRAELAYRVQDTVAAWSQGLEVKGAPTSGELIAAYGPERGQQMYDGLLRAQQFGTDMQTYATLPINERPAFAESKLKRGEAVVAGSGFAEQSQLNGKLIQQFQDLNKQLATDGSGYAIKYAPQVSAAWDAVQNVQDPEAAPGTYQAFAESVTAEQSRLGIPAASQTILPASYVNQLAAAFKDPANAGPRQLQLIDEMKQNWGQFYPQVFRQVTASVPDSVKVIGSGVDKDTATLLSGISATKTADLKKPLPGADVTVMSESLKAAMEPWRVTFAAQAGGPETFATFYNEAERGALVMMSSGVSAQDAAEDMSKRMSANYQIDGTLRVPKEYDIDTVQEGLGVAISRIKPADVRLSEVGGITAQFTEERFRTILNASQAYINKNEDGVYLMYNGAAILGPDGRALDFKFDDLLGLSVEEPEKPLVDQLPGRLR